MRRALALSLLLLAGCPKIQTTIFTFDLKAGTGTVEYRNILTDDASSADADFMELVNTVIQGTRLEDDHPGWRISDKRFFENEGRLDGLVTFTFDRPEDVDVYKHDKKSPWFWCSSSVSETLVSTNGTRIEEVIPGCVVWDRKESVLVLEVTSGDPGESDQSLLPQFQRWSAGEVLAGGGGDGLGALGAMMGGDMGAGDGSMDALGEQLALGLLEGFSAGLGLQGELTRGAVAVEGPLTAAQADQGLGAVAIAGVKMCFQAAALEGGAPTGSTRLEVAVTPAGAVERVALDGAWAGGVVETCVRDQAASWTFPAAGGASRILLPLDFAL